MRASRPLALILGAIVAFLAYVLGAYSYRDDLGPIHWYRAFASRARGNNHPHDVLGRYIDVANKTLRDCPKQDGETGVILAIGQSNSGNSGEHYTSLAGADSIFNYWDGKCYDALPPLLGATGKQGSFLPLLAEKLISLGVYRRVVIASSGIMGSNVGRWGSGGDLLMMLRDVVAKLTGAYRITDVVWHQGEADFLLHTSALEYELQFGGLLAMLRENSVSAPVFIALASKCADGGYWDRLWRPSNPVVEAQKKLVSAGLVSLGADTDSVITEEFRLADGCHLNLAGETAVAASYAEAIRNYHAQQKGR